MPAIMEGPVEVAFELLLEGEQTSDRWGQAGQEPKPLTSTGMTTNSRTGACCLQGAKRAAHWCQGSMWTARDGILPQSTPGVGSARPAAV